MDINFHFFGVNALSMVAGSYGKYVFCFFRNCQTVFQSDCIILRSHQQYLGNPVLHILASIWGHALNVLCDGVARCNDEAFPSGVYGKFSSFRVSSQPVI